MKDKEKQPEKPNFNYINFCDENSTGSRLPRTKFTKQELREILDELIQGEYFSISVDHIKQVFKNHGIINE